MSQTERTPTQIWMASTSPPTRGVSRRALMISVLAAVALSIAGTLGALQLVPGLAPVGPPGARSAIGATGPRGEVGPRGAIGPAGKPAPTPTATPIGQDTADDVLERWCSILYNASVYHNDNDSLAADMYNACH